jgi:hypothetical protein
MILSKCEMGLQLKKVAAQKIALEHISAFGGDFAPIVPRNAILQAMLHQVISKTAPYLKISAF